MKVCFINGSPRGKSSGSQFLIGEISSMIKKEEIKVDNICIVDCLKNRDLEEVFCELLDYDSLVFTFPLYVDSIPSSMLDFMTQFETFVHHQNNVLVKRPKVYAVVNCGFIEGEQNKHALKIMEHFSDKIEFSWQMGVGIGAGEFLARTPDLPLENKVKRNILKAFNVLVQHIKDEELDVSSNILESPKIPRFIFIFMGSRGWVQWAKKNSLKKKQLMARPYK
ncbi:NAD(P)H-dependent oxidoreductase [Vallitalea okinawensis]|uniref:NAD(P)H-dependent oxidoreductase n=1 Tax=Vallitalea okinawensis TaxID=2078660 RepID=UPI000CFB256A|nr:NAD(P)H-dependent oxidoreductase [Vallitalea okinawensis]